MGSFRRLSARLPVGAIVASVRPLVLTPDRAGVTRMGLSIEIIVGPQRQRFVLALMSRVNPDLLTRAARLGYAAIKVLERRAATTTDPKRHLSDDILHAAAQLPVVVRLHAGSLGSPGDGEQAKANTEADRRGPQEQPPRRAATSRAAPTPTPGPKPTTPAPAAKEGPKQRRRRS